MQDCGLQIPGLTNNPIAYFDRTSAINNLAVLSKVIMLG